MLFAAIGAVGTGFHYLVLVIGVQLISLSPTVASSFGFASGALVNYLLTRRYVFHSSKPHFDALTKFLSAAGIGFGLNAAIMSALVNAFGLHYLLAQVVATLVVLGWNYSASRAWAFKEAT